MGFYQNLYKMKKLKTNSFSALLILALLTFGGHQAMAFSAYQQDLDSRNFSYLQADQNRQGAFFQEISAPVFSFFSEKEPQFFGGRIKSLEFHSFNDQNFSAEAVKKFLRRDHRKVLNQQIFPFHFFW